MVSYTGISGSDLTGCTRGANNSTARAHNSGAVVETTPTVGLWNSLVTAISNVADTNGLLAAINSPVSIAYLKLTRTDVSSIASIAQAHITNLIGTNATLSGVVNVSPASVLGIGMSPAFIGSGFYSGPTTTIGGILVAPRAGTLKWVSAFTRFVASTASVGFDFKIRNASAFANATMRPAIAAGGTFVSTASIGTVNINAGDLLQGDIGSVGANGAIQQITIMGGTA